MGRLAADAQLIQIVRKSVLLVLARLLLGNNAANNAWREIGWVRTTGLLVPRICALQSIGGDV